MRLPRRGLPLKVVEALIAAAADVNKAGMGFQGGNMFQGLCRDTYRLIGEIIPKWGENQMDKNLEMKSNLGSIAFIGNSCQYSLRSVRDTPQDDYERNVGP